jgi:hypothetical protein
MRPNLTVSPYRTALLSDEGDEESRPVGPHLVVTAPWSCIENSYPKASLQLAERDVGGGAERSKIVQLMSAGIRSPSPTLHSMFPDGVVNTSTSASAGAVVIKIARAERPRIDHPSSE